MTPNKQTLMRYLEGSNLTEQQRKALAAEFDTAQDKEAVMRKAVSMNGRKVQTKVAIPNRK